MLLPWHEPADVLPAAGGIARCPEALIWGVTLDHEDA